jgi:penicillin-binding protein 1A
MSDQGESAQTASGNVSDEAPTASLKESMERARQMRAARRGAAGTSPASPSEAAQDLPEQDGAAENGHEANGNGRQARERRLARAARVLGQAGKESETPVTDPVQEEEMAVPPADPDEEPTLSFGEQARPTPAAPLDEAPAVIDAESDEITITLTPESPPAERQTVAEVSPAPPVTTDAPNEVETFFPASPSSMAEASAEPSAEAGPVLTRAETEMAPAAEDRANAADETLPSEPVPPVTSESEGPFQHDRERDGWVREREDAGWRNGRTGKHTAALVPNRTNRLPETAAELEAEEGGAEESQALILVDAPPKTEPMPAIGISRKRLVSEDARRERTQRLRKDAAKRWRRRRRFALYRMEHSRKRQEHYNKLVRRAVLSAVSLVALVIMVALGVTLQNVLAYYQSQASLVNNLPNATSRDNVEIFDSKGTLLYSVTTDGIKHYIKLSKVSINVINATIAIEDKDFWTNQGIDFTAIVRAASADLQAGQTVQGGSSITQQLIKNTVTGSDTTFDRKIREAILAVGITQQYTKAQILEMYLNTIPYGLSAYGDSVYGIDAAAQQYFNLSDHGSVTGASQLDLAQASFLAGIPNDPPNLSPFCPNNPANRACNLKTTLERQRVVLAAMVSQGYITSAEATQAEAESAAPNFLKSPPQPPDLAPHFVEWVENQLADMIDSGKLSFSLSGLRVYTTLDLDLQNQIQQILTDHLNSIAYLHVNDGAVVAIDQHTGAILTMLGSANYYDQSIDGQFNVATEGYRQMGSSFKPITYVTAFEKGWFPAQTIFNGPTAFVDDYQYGYRPLNYSRNDMGEEFTIRQALQMSMNIPAVKALEFAGVNDTLNMAERLGISSYQGTPGLSMTLGSLDVHMMDLVSAYSTFANYGVRNQPFGIWRITDQSGNTVFQYTPHGQQVISPQLAYLMTSILTDNSARAPEFGSCSPLYLFDTYANCYAGNVRPAAAKTGTTEDFKDDLTMGYTMDLTMGVWVGNSDDSSTYEQTGIQGAAPIWHDAMLAAEASRPYLDFPVPSGVEQHTYCSNGRCTNDWFISAALPANGIGNGGTMPPKDCLTVQPGQSNGENWKVECKPAPPTPGGGGGTGGGGGGGGGHGGGGAVTPGATIYGPVSQYVPSSGQQPNQQPKPQPTPDVIIEATLSRR